MSRAALWGLLLCGLATVAPVSAETVAVAVQDPDRVLMGVTNWTGAGDCSAVCHLTREGEGLRIAVDVKDDHLITGPELSSPERDGVELFFDLRPHRLRWKRLYEPGVFQVTIPAGEGSVAPELAGPGLPPSPWPVAGRKIVPGGYRVEWLLPGDWLATLPAVIRERFGFDVCVIDADPGGPGSKLCAYGTLLNWRDPKEFGLIELPR